jgi:hypothetical protein
MGVEYVSLTGNESAISCAIYCPKIVKKLLNFRSKTGLEPNAKLILRQAGNVPPRRDFQRGSLI